LIARLHLQEFVAQAIARQLLAFGADVHDIELGLVALGNALVAEQRLDADQGRLRRHRQHQLALDRPAAGFHHADEDLRLLRTGRRRRLGERHREGRHPIGVSLGQVLDRGALVAGGLFIGHAKLVAGIARPSGSCGRDQQVALELQARSRGAVEELAGHLQFNRNLGFDHLFLG
jgi:hypothetical protein